MLGSVCSALFFERRRGGDENSLFAELGGVVDEQVDHNVAGRGFEKDTHDHDRRCRVYLR